MTGGLLGRYIAEERDSGRHFADCYKALCERDPKPAEQVAADGGGGAAALVTAGSPTSIVLLPPCSCQQPSLHGPSERFSELSP